MTEESIYYIVIALYAFYLRSILYLSKLSLPFIEQIVSHTTSQSTINGYTTINTILLVKNGYRIIHN